METDVVMEKDHFLCASQGVSSEWLPSGAAPLCSSGFQSMSLHGPAMNKENVLCIPKCYQQLPCRLFGNVLPIHLSAQNLPQAIPTSANHWKSTSKEKTSDMMRWKVRCNSRCKHWPLVPSPWKLIMWCIPGTNVLVNQTIMWRYRRSIHYSLFFWISILK